MNSAVLPASCLFVRSKVEIGLYEQTKAKQSTGRKLILAYIAHTEPHTCPSMAQKADKKSIVFVHPDLGIGGAERLVIDAAVGLQSCGHKITILTSYRDKNHCFDEARDGR